MFESMSFTTLLLSEIILILGIVVALLQLYVWKQRKIYRRLLDEYRKLRQIASDKLENMDHPEHPESVLQQIASSSNTTATDSIASYLERTRLEALARYQKLGQGNIPRLAPELPFSAKVAALRFLYTEIEAENYRETTSLHGRWMTIERKLAEVVRWIGQEKRNEKPQRNHRLRLLQERIDTLKPFETENARLKKQLAMAKTRQQRLEQFKTDTQQTISKLEKTIRSLRRNSGGEPESPEAVQKKYRHFSAEQHLDEAVEAHEKSVGQLTSITDISDQKSVLLRKIADELNISYADIEPEQRDKLENFIKTLELDLLKSDHLISNLKKELQNTRDNVNQQPLVITAKSKASASPLDLDQFRPDTPSPLEKAEQIEDVLKVIHTNLAESEEDLSQSMDLRNGEGHQRTLAEIQKLRMNNQNQRNMIIDLEKELRSLRREAKDTDDETVTSARNNDINRLERLVKECEHCIETLESEVDLLHMQIQEGHNKKIAPAGGPIEPVEAVEAVEPDIVKLNQELETASNLLQKTIKQYQQTSITNRFTLDILSCDTVEAVARRLIQALKDLHIVVGFTLHSALGQAEYYAGNHFNPQEKQRIKKAPSEQNIGYLNEGILFTNSHLHLMLKNPPNVDEEQSSLELSLVSLINIAADRLQHLELSSVLGNHEQTLGNWIKDTKHHLTELDIQYAFQTEESRKVISNLVSELKRATEMIDMSPSARIVFDNAIDECQDRVGMMLESGKGMDKEFSRVFEDLDKITLGKKQTSTS